jgi:hypothetical protein
MHTHLRLSNVVVVEFLEFIDVSLCACIRPFTLKYTHVTSHHTASHIHENRQLIENWSGLVRLNQIDRLGIKNAWLINWLETYWSTELFSTIIHTNVIHLAFYKSHHHIITSDASRLLPKGEHLKYLLWCVESRIEEALAVVRPFNTTELHPFNHIIQINTIARAPNLRPIRCESLSSYVANDVTTQAYACISMWYSFPLSHSCDQIAPPSLPSCLTPSLTYVNSHPVRPSLANSISTQTAVVSEAQRGNRHCAICRHCIGVLQESEEMKAGDKGGKR